MSYKQTMLPVIYRSGELKSIALLNLFLLTLCLPLKTDNPLNLPCSARTGGAQAKGNPIKKEIRKSSKTKKKCEAD
jgi:hypothetical protein